MKKKFTAVLLFLFAFNGLHSQWSLDPSVNTPICVATGRQIDPRMIEDGEGGAFIAWKDYRAGVSDVYVQRINAQGQVMWTVDGVGACTDPADQSTPGICADGNGGCIVAWSDWRSGIERDLYAQRFNGSGVAQWTPQGAPVATKFDREHNERIVPDGTGGCIVVWEQQTGAGWDVWAQRLRGNGTQVWTSGGIAVSTFLAYRINGRIQEDGTGGAVIVWQEMHNGFEYDIYGQHFDSLGTRLWGTEGIAICAATGVQNAAKIEADPVVPGGCYVAWADRRAGIGYDIYAQRLSYAGVAQWAANGVAVSTATGSQSAVDMLCSPDVDGAILTWKDFRSGNYDIYAQKISPAGVPQWTADGVPLCTSVNDQVNPNIVEDLLGGGIVVWQDSSDGTWNAKAQRIGSSGNVVWTVNGENVGTAADNQTSPKNCTDGLGGAIFVFQDKRSTVFDLYAHHLFGDGQPVTGVTKPVQTYAFTASPNPFNQELEVTTDCRDCSFSVSAPDGRLLWSGTDVHSAPLGQWAPGLYFLSLHGDVQQTLRIVKQ